MVETFSSLDLAYLHYGAEASLRQRLPQHTNPHLSIQYPRGAFAGFSGALDGEGRGFSRFPPLAVGQGESQQPTDSSHFQPQG